MGFEGSARRRLARINEATERNTPPVRSRPVYAELSLRGEIENVLQRDERDYERGRLVPSSWTSRELATELDADRYAVRSELIALKQEGRVIVNGLQGWRWQRA